MAGTRPRGRPPRPQPAKQLGYRATEDVRRHLDLARAFLDLTSHQAVIDEAVAAFLTDLRSSNPDYADAAAALDRQLAKDRESVTSLQAKRQ